MEKRPPIISEEAFSRESLKNRQKALEKREEFSQALEKSASTNELLSVLRGFAFMSYDLREDGEMMIPGFKKVFPEYRGKDDFGFQKDDYAIDTEHPLKSTLDAIERYNRGEVTEYELYQEVDFNNPTLPALERITGISLESLIHEDVKQSAIAEEPVVVEGEVLEVKD